MMYNYLSLPLAIGVFLLDTTVGVSMEVPVNGHSQQITVNSANLVTTQVTTEVPPTTAKLKDSSYLGLMNAGYVANQKQDYLMAINYFQQALKIQPGDFKAAKAIRNVSTYGFDLYMQSGYSADRVRNYTAALQSFQKALQIRPDSWYAQQAIANVTGYLAQQPVTPSSTDNNSTDNNSANTSTNTSRSNSTNNSTNDRDNGFSVWLMLIGIGAASALSAGLLFYLFKKTGSSLQEPEIKDLESSESDETQSEAEESSSIKTATDRFENHQESETTDNSESLSATSQLAKSALESNDDSSITASTKSLSKLDIVPELIQDLNKSDRSTRRKAVWELAQRGDSRAMKPLVELMMEVDSQERGLILEAMTQIAGRTLKPMNKALMMSLRDDNSQVKQNAIRDLTRVYDLMSQVTKRLSQAVEDSDDRVQETAKWALKKLNQMPADSTWKADNLTDEVKKIKDNSNSNNGKNGTDRSREQKFPLS